MDKGDAEGKKGNLGIIKDGATKLGEILADKAVDARDAAVDVKEDIQEKLTELDRILKDSITEYNDVFTLMNDKGVTLLTERKRSVDSIDFCESLINSISNKPKSFDADFDEVNVCRQQFADACEFAERELYDARKAASGAGAGLAAGASVTFMAPTAAMWVATTFGTASTGAAISTLSGAAANSAALAWLGGGAITAGGHGMAMGNALLAMAGPIGWSIAGATLLASIVLFAKKTTKRNKEKNEEIKAVKNNIEAVKEMDIKLSVILEETTDIRVKLNAEYKKCISLYDADYTQLNDEQKVTLGSLVNNTKALSAMLSKTVE